MKHENLKGRFVLICVIAVLEGFLWIGCSGKNATGPELEPEPELEQEQLPAQHDKGDLIVDLPNGLTMAFILLQPGTFTMGTPKTGVVGSDIERPHHEVTFTHSFYIGKYEVTREQWYSLMDGEAGEGDKNLPIVDEGWRNIGSFIGKMNESLGGKYTVRIPTEPEWEYACRAGTTAIWWFGDVLPTGEDPLTYMVVGRTEIQHTWPSDLNLLQIVGSTLPNPWGIYDMYGNAAEACGLYGKKTGVLPIEPYQSPAEARFTGTAYPSTPQTDPQYSDPPSGIHIPFHSGQKDWVPPFPIRGGSVISDKEAARSASRHFSRTLDIRPNFYNDGFSQIGPTGFRLVLFQN